MAADRGEEPRGQKGAPHDVELILYGRGYCHLCDDMREALRPLEAELGFTVREVDVDSEDALEEAFGELVPVLAHGEARLCHYFLDEGAVRRHFASLERSAQGPSEGAS